MDMEKHLLICLFISMVVILVMSTGKGWNSYEEKNGIVKLENNSYHK
jgi:hypothetical protein